MTYKKKLKDLYKLQHKVRVYVPSTVDVSVEADTSESLRSTLEAFGEWFGGATSYRAVGAWLSQTGALVTERVTIVESYCTDVLLDQHIENILALCASMKRELSQEAIALEINGELHFV